MKDAAAEKASDIAKAAKQKSQEESVKESHQPDRHESTGVSRVGDIFWANASCTRKEKCKMMGIAKNVGNSRNHRNRAWPRGVGWNIESFTCRASLTV
ncbi:hypothetical protein JHK82_036017 [Glycine max]|nr:hypothetical protein JHK82_036017 [Glycine max]